MDRRIPLNKLEDKAVKKEFDGEAKQSEPETQVPPLPEDKKEEAAEKVFVERQKTAEVIPQSSRVLLHVVSYHVPLIIPRTEVIVDEIKVNIRYSYFFGLIQQVRSVLIKEVTGVVYESNVIFGSLKISTGEFKETDLGATTPGPPGQPPQPALNKGPIQAKFFRPDDALKARRVIQGLIIMNKEKTNTSQMSPQEALEKAISLGTAVY